MYYFDEYKCLKNIRNGKLNTKQIGALNSLKEYIHKLKSKEIDDNYLDLIYLYIQLWALGFVEEEKDFIEWCCGNVVYIITTTSKLIDMKILRYYRKYPLAFENIGDFINNFSPSILSPLYDFYHEVILDESIAFRYALVGSTAYPSGFCGGLSLVNELECIDNCLLAAGKCYLRGIGTEKDYPKAFECFCNYRRDHLSQKWEYEIKLEESTLNELFNKLKEESNAGINYPGLHYSLARMYREGMGTTYNHAKYLECVSKEKELANNNPYLKMLEKYEKFTINELTDGSGFDNVKTIDDKSFKLNDIICFGKYDSRDILWRVVKIKDDKALLLATDCLESTYMAEEQEQMGNYDYNDSSVHLYTKYLISWNEIFKIYNTENKEFDYESVLCPNENGDYVFLLSKEEIESLDSKVFAKIKLEGARIQAQENGFDCEGAMLDEETHTPCWWTSTDGEYPGEVFYVNQYGKFEETDIDCYDIGIKPAICLKLNR